jgi:hypothetical protein
MTEWQNYCLAWFEDFVRSKPRPISIEVARAHFEEWAKTHHDQFVNTDHPEKGTRRVIGSVGGVGAIMAKVIPTLCVTDIKVFPLGYLHMAFQDDTGKTTTLPVALAILGQLKADWVRDEGMYYIGKIAPAPAEPQ